MNRTKLCPQIISGWVSAPDPAGAAYDRRSSKPPSRLGTGVNFLPRHLPSTHSAGFGRLRLSFRRLPRLKSNVPLPKQFSGSAPEWYSGVCESPTRWPVGPNSNWPGYQFPVILLWLERWSELLYYWCMRSILRYMKLLVFIIMWVILCQSGLL